MKFFIFFITYWKFGRCIICENSYPPAAPENLTCVGINYCVKYLYIEAGLALNKFCDLDHGCSKLQLGWNYNVTYYNNTIARKVYCCNTDFCNVQDDPPLKCYNNIGTSKYEQTCPSGTDFCFSGYVGSGAAVTCDDTNLCYGNGCTKNVPVGNGKKFDKVCCCDSDLCNNHGAYKQSSIVILFLLLLAVLLLN
uniref:Uncharacterized protein n=1 Tax=Acrobeloides nanus TaxID=290746 RepID=A0A914EB87_9BILA